MQGPCRMDNGAMSAPHHDPLSDLLRTMKVESSVYYRAVLRGAFGLALPSCTGRVRYHLVLNGQLHIELPTEASAAHLRAGDVFLVNRGVPHVLSDRPGRPLVPVEAAKARLGLVPGQIFEWGSGTVAATLACGEFSFLGELFHPILEALPTLLHCSSQGAAADPDLARLLDTVDRETAAAAAGWMAVVDRLTAAVFVLVLRAWLAKQPKLLGVVQAVRDPLIGRSLSAMHREPARDWTLEDLARHAGMSRTRFAVTFKALIGVSPMRYLARWRIEFARSLMHDTDLSVADIADRVGYGSQATFTKAFRELVGMPPAAYRTKATRLAETERRRDVR